MNSENKEFKALRESYWSEFGAEEKINILKNELYRTQLQVARLCGYISDLLQHEHSGNRIVKPIGSPNYESYNLLFRVNEFK